jgi:hypothetical protein
MRIMSVVLVASLLALSATDVLAQEAGTWRTVAQAVPLGTKVKIQTTDGKHVSGTLMSVDPTSVTVKRNTRRPAPGVVVPFDRVANIERDTGGGMSWGKALGIGLGAGAGVILTIFIIALQLD